MTTKVSISNGHVCITEEVEVASVAEANVLKFLHAEETNGFGFQFDASEGELTLFSFWQKDAPSTSIRTDEEILISVRNATGSVTFKTKAFLGRVFACISYREWDLIPQVFQWFLDSREFLLSVCCRLAVQLKPGDTFSFELLERRFVEDFVCLAFSLCPTVGYERGSNQKNKQWRAIGWRLAYDNRRALAKHYNWRTQVGKSLCSSIRESLGKKPVANFEKSHFRWPGVDDACRQFRIAHRGVWSGHEPSNERPKELDDDETIEDENAE